MSEISQTMASPNSPKIVKEIPKKSFKQKVVYDFKKNWIMYLIFLPVLAYYAIFYYAPMFGIVMAFQDYDIVKGISGSEFNHFANFSKLFGGEDFGTVLRNTSMMALLNLTIGFVFPVVFAILLSNVKPKWFKRTIQITSYMPYFVAAVVVAEMFKEFLGGYGFLTELLASFGLGTPDKNWLYDANPPVFWLINCLIEVWQGTGYGAIVYCAAIANVNPNLHEAAAIDGASRWKRLWHVVMPSILPLIITMFTLRVGLVFVQGFDKVILLENNYNLATSNSLVSYINRVAFGGRADYGLATAAGLFQSVIATFLLVVSNSLSRKLAKSSLF